MHLTKLLIYALIVTALPFTVNGQKGVGTYLGDESAFYASTKQVNQFFRRFNSEEDEEGNRIYNDSKKYHSPRLRRKYIEILFDNETSSLDKALKEIFIKDVTDATAPIFLEFHGGEWFAEVHTRFNFYGKESAAILFMKLQEEPVGSKWVIDKVYFEPFNELFKKKSDKDGKFLHPLSHELDFMNLNKIFEKKEDVELYTSREHKPDHLSLFLLELKKGNLSFVTIKNVKFHFFQIDNWYFELSEFNRKGYNTGWLISNLAKLDGEQKESYKKFIFFEND
ncbi:hypothetical protein QQ020_15990 [Fulvivirgaceae bacterium BMA12]|uniref:Uncharacterized protein n=1 Tax=Agaribacillus aureus TaxID=3051825 RepID=A0ABT8LBA5_9BACT|nr:hypothetical protein [Fulvivirgaceae bacterium BMA12]